MLKKHKGWAWSFISNHFFNWPPLTIRRCSKFESNTFYYIFSYLPTTLAPVRRQLLAHLQRRDGSLAGGQRRLQADHKQGRLGEDFLKVQFSDSQHFLAKGTHKRRNFFFILSNFVRIKGLQSASNKWKKWIWARYHGHYVKGGQDTMSFRDLDCR